MSKLIAIIGNSGVGKTTLVKRLCAAGNFAAGLEQHIERPFQAKFAAPGAPYALATQIDYLLLRAEQEIELRRECQPALLDGGLEMDYYVFTHLFHQKGYLAPDEFELCQRLYTTLRAALPPPEIIIYLHAPLEIIAERFAQRGRKLEIAALNDLAAMQALLDAWLSRVAASTLITIDASSDDPSYTMILPILLEKLATPT